MITEKYIQLFEKQISKIDDADFDLEAWKSGTVVLLARVFGDASTKISEIEKIRFDFGSWSLRDSSGSRDQMDSCKKRGKGILEACITELQILGIENTNIDDISPKLLQSKLSDSIKNAIEEELKISQYRSLLKIINTQSSPVDKKRMLFTALMGYDQEIASKIVANIMTDPLVKKIFK